MTVSKSHPIKIVRKYVQIIPIQMDILIYYTLILKVLLRYDFNLLNHQKINIKIRKTE